MSNVEQHVEKSFTHYAKALFAKNKLNIRKENPETMLQDFLVRKYHRIGHVKRPRNSGEFLQITVWAQSSVPPQEDKL